MKNIIAENATRVEQTDFTTEDRALLQKRRKDNFIFISACYLLFISLCVFFLTRSYENFDLDIKSFRTFFSKSDNEGIGQLAPYICLVLIVAASLYFIKQYRRKIVAANKDLSSGSKWLVYFPGMQSVEPMAGHYLKIPLRKPAKVEVGQQVIEKLTPADEFCVEVTSTGRILRLTQNRQIVKTL